MDYLPIFVDLKKSTCLVVGGGDIAARKANLLCQAQTKVTVISPEVSDAMTVLIDGGSVNWLQAAFSTDIEMPYRLVIAATDDETVNEQVYHYAKAHKILVNVADKPQLYYLQF